MGGEEGGGDGGEGAKLRSKVDLIRSFEAGKRNSIEFTEGSWTYDIAVYKSVVFIKEKVTILQACRVRSRGQRFKSHTLTL